VSEAGKDMLDGSKTAAARALNLRGVGKNRAMRRLTLILTIVAAFAAPGVASAASTTGVNIYGSGFSPKNVTITEGDTVTWVNRDNANHQVLASKGEFVSTILHPGNRFSFTFRAAGTYHYSDELHPKLTGTVTVKGLPPSLTLAASEPISTAGDKVTLSGVVSSHNAGESVSIYYQPYPQTNLILRVTLLTGTGGTFSYIVAPGVLTTYQASWKGAFATPTTIQVRPRLSLGRSGAWIVHAYATRSMAGREVQFQRYDPSTGRWLTLRKVMLGSTSSARFALTLPKGVNQIRLAMSVNQAGAGYLGAIGPTITWRQR
jgi:plastocyanin